MKKTLLAALMLPALGAATAAHAYQVCLDMPEQRRLLMHIKANLISTVPLLITRLNGLMASQPLRLKT